MLKKTYFITVIIALMVWAFSFAVYAAGPNLFSAAIYADGEAWATKGLGDLPAPNENNQQSFDMLFAFVNGADGQLPVAEAAPGNQLYNGGRWNLQFAMWMISDPPVLTSFDEIEWYEARNELVTTSANQYFECPLLPLKIR